MTQKGQSLVEMALATPLLIFILIGLFEVGYVIRDFMIIDYFTREVARYASRSDVLNFEEATGYQRVVKHAHNILDQDVGIIISLYDVPSQLPCEPRKRAEPVGMDFWPNCDCELAMSSPYQTVTVRSPASDFQLRYRTDPTLVTRLDDNALIQQLNYGNFMLNCEKMKQSLSTVPMGNHTIVIEVFKEHYQLFGFPLISNPLTDPIPVYSKMVMRQTYNRE